MDSNVLVLNANYAPLNICTTRRAIGLLVTGKAEMLINGRGYVRTVRISLPRPSVIRLGYMIKRPRPQVRLCKREIFRRDNHTCQYCGARSVRLTVDHIVPRHRGGEVSWTNLVTACATCNVRKGGRTLEEARLRLLRPAREPRATAEYLYAAYLIRNREWEPFIHGW